MAPEDRYLTLITALPAHGPLFGAKQTPLSRLRLQMRLDWLLPDDAEDLARFARVVDWHHQRFDLDDETFVRQAERELAEIRNAFTRGLAAWLLELRTVVAALRRRRAGAGAPSGRRRWGCGRWVPHIARHWSEPHFGLARVYPWLPEAKRLMDDGDPVGLERLLLGVDWTHLERIGAEHWFDFEAVVVYVTRWDLVARWTRYDADAALARFDALLDSALAGVTLDPAA
ncbi:DUF2764 family protein [Thiohalocapsa sp. ML1]|jgi:hypothetical protein|uniref:DUF2764 family protein n=1 Tax=Thiohalocapsa sp. ML1 TaxID=1431688 RepID=UPI0007322F11|nr:DUF2764 family protein [Thiohalocapsa sp. ML1]